MNEKRIDFNITERIAANVYGSRYQFLRDDALQRISDTNEFYTYYNLDEGPGGQYWSMPHSLGYKPTIMPVNLARWFVKKRTGWMFEVAPDIECPAPQVDDTAAMETTGYSPSPAQMAANLAASDREQILYGTWTGNSLEEKLLEGGRDYYISGTVALKLRYLPGVGIRLDFVPGQEVFPIPNPDNRDTFDAVHFCSFYDNDKTLWKQSWELLEGKCYLSEGYYDLNLNLLGTKYNRVDTGLDFIPVLIFSRERLSGDVHGTSYLKDLIPLFDQYNRVMSDAADSLRFNLFAVTVLLNSSPDAEKSLKVSPGAIWNVGGDSPEVKKLESSFNYSKALDDFLTRLENLMHMLGETPDITPDRIKGFGLVSGVALKLLYSDLVSATQQDWRVWKSRLVTANEYILRMVETFELDGSESVGGNYTNRIIPHLPLPENEAEKVSIEAQKLATSAQSVKGMLQELGEKFPERKMAEIITERERFMPAMGKQLTVKEQGQLSGA